MVSTGVGSLFRAAAERFGRTMDAAAAARKRVPPPSRHNSELRRATQVSLAITTRRSGFQPSVPCLAAFALMLIAAPAIAQRPRLLQPRPGQPRLGQPQQEELIAVAGNPF